jgi:hypothetical protein
MQDFRIFTRAAARLLHTEHAQQNLNLRLIRSFMYYVGTRRRSRQRSDTSRCLRTLGNLRLARRIAGYLTRNLLPICEGSAGRVAWPPSPLPALSVLCSAAHGFNTQDNKRSGSSGTLFRYFRND